MANVPSAKVGRLVSRIVWQFDIKDPSATQLACGEECSHDAMFQGDSGQQEGKSREYKAEVTAMINRVTLGATTARRLAGGRRRQKEPPGCLSQSTVDATYLTVRCMVRMGVGDCGIRLGKRAGCGRRRVGIIVRAHPSRGTFRGSFQKMYC